MCCGMSIGEDYASSHSATSPSSSCCQCVCSTTSSHSRWSWSSTAATRPTLFAVYTTHCTYCRQRLFLSLGRRLFRLTACSSLIGSLSKFSRSKHAPLTFGWPPQVWKSDLQVPAPWFISPLGPSAKPMFQLCFLVSVVRAARIGFARLRVHLWLDSIDSQLCGRALSNYLSEFRLGWSNPANFKT